MTPGILRRAVLALVLPIVLLVQAHAQEVIPDFYRNPGLQPNRSFVNQHFSEHIDPFTGALQLHYVDINLPGSGGFDISVRRSYNTAAINPDNPNAYESRLGLGWTTHFGRVLKTRNTSICFNGNEGSVVDNPVLELPDGSRQLLAFTGYNTPLMLTTQRWKADCINNGTGLAVYSPTGIRYEMTRLFGVGSAYAWYTTKISDRNGNFATVSYDQGTVPQVLNIVASDGRRVDFEYLDGGSNTSRISRISGSGGQVYQYYYRPVNGVSGKYFLEEVRRPDGTSWR